MISLWARNDEGLVATGDQDSFEAAASFTSREKTLLAILLLLEIVFSLFMIVQQRIPAGHDGLQYFMYQHYFLNNSAQSGQIAQWSSYVTLGTMAHPWYGYVASPVFAVALQGGRLVHFLSAVTWFHLGFLFDNILLLVGTWLLARRFFKHPETTFFVCIGVVGGAIWVSQPWFNFHFYTAVPLMLHLGHRFLETGRWRFVAAAGNLLALQTLGNIPYAIPATTFVIAAYFFCFVLCNWPLLRRAWGLIRFNWRAALALFIFAASLYFAYRLVAIGSDRIIRYSPGRNIDSTVSLGIFLTWGIKPNWEKWYELWLRSSVLLDFTLYFGVLALALAIFAVFSMPRNQSHFVWFAAIILLVARATTVPSEALYYAWPGMKYFRHLGMLNVFVRLALCFIAGTGFEQLLYRVDWKGFARNRGIAAVISLASLTGAAMLVYLSRAPQAALVLFLQMMGRFAIRRIHNMTVLYADLEPARLLLSAAFLIAVAAIVAIQVMWSGRRPRPRWLIPAALTIALLDLYSYKLDYFWQCTDVAKGSELVAYRPLPFVEQRVAGLDQGSPSFLELKHLSRLLNSPSPAINTFIFADEASSTYRIDYWLEPLNLLLRTYAHLPLRQDNAPSVDSVGSLKFVLTNPSASKVAGIKPGRIQCFDSAWDADTDQTASNWLDGPHFTGDSLILQKQAGAMADASVEAAPGNINDLATSHRLSLAYQVRSCDANNLELGIANTSDKKAWLLYCDVWDDGWSAWVNGRSVPVRRADLAYKAVLLEPGDNGVDFGYSGPELGPWSSVFSSDAAMWIIFVLGTVISVLVRGRLPLDPPMR